MARRPSASGRCAGAHPAPLMASAEGERIAPLRHAGHQRRLRAWVARVLAVGHGQDAGEGCRREKNGNCAAWHTRPCRAVSIFFRGARAVVHAPEKNGFFSGIDHRSGFRTRPHRRQRWPDARALLKVRRAHFSAADGQRRRGSGSPPSARWPSAAASSVGCPRPGRGHGQDAGEGCRREKNGNCAAWHTRPCRAVSILFESGARAVVWRLKRMASFQA